MIVKLTGCSIENSKRLVCLAFGATVSRHFNSFKSVCSIGLGSHDFQFNLDLLVARQRELIAQFQIDRGRAPVLHFDFVRHAQRGGDRR